MQDKQFVENVEMLALLCMVGKAKEVVKGCAELLWQENMSSLVAISPSFHKILDLGGSIRI